jgi:hypothetical protein
MWVQMIILDHLCGEENGDFKKITLGKMHNIYLLMFAAF